MMAIIAPVTMVATKSRMGLDMLRLFIESGDQLWPDLTPGFIVLNVTLHVNRWFAKPYANTILDQEAVLVGVDFFHRNRFSIAVRAMWWLVLPSLACKA